MRFKPLIKIKKLFGTSRGKVDKQVEPEWVSHATYKNKVYTIGERYRVISPRFEADFKAEVVAISKSGRPVFKPIDGKKLPHDRFRRTGTHIMELGDRVERINHFEEGLFTI